MASRAPRRSGLAERPGMADVARLAGVSAQTVSRALRNDRSVRPSTRVRVLAAVDELGYRPNNVARALSTGRTRIIGVVAADTATFSGAAIRRGIEVAARRAGFVVATASVEPGSSASVAAAMASLVDHGVEGVIVAAAPPDRHAPAGPYELDVPVVTVGHTVADAIPVGVDQVRAGRLATDHLLGLGHRTVWHVAGPADSDGARQREGGWRESLLAAGREVPPPLPGDWTAESGYRLGLTLADGARDIDVTAVFVASDEMAFGLLRALAEQGRSVPGDCAVVGMDDIALAAYASPPLSTVRQPFVELGGAAVRALLLGDGAPVVFGPELVVRRSCGGRG